MTFPSAAVLCTHNVHKVHELQLLLPALDLRPLAPDDQLPPETGATFVDNARIKAHGGAALHPGKWAIADDSGLEVDALGGRPGVHSARFAGQDATDEQNNELLLRELDGVRDRRARFVCVLVALAPDGRRELVARGTVEGTIATAPSGSNGFGYDPLFVPDGHTESFGVLPPAVKHALSHRGTAARELARLLEREGMAPAGAGA